MQVFRRLEIPVVSEGFQTYDDFGKPKSTSVGRSFSHRHRQTHFSDLHRQCLGNRTEVALGRRLVRLTAVAKSEGPRAASRREANDLNRELGSSELDTYRRSGSSVRNFASGKKYGQATFVTIHA